MIDALRRLARLVAIVGTLGLAGSAAGAPHKILVLPVDGTADAATRTRLTSRIVKLARTLDGQVATAETTFADTALAVGCDPKSAGCSDLVIATLGVDELVWGTTTRSDGQTRFAIRRALRGLAPREVLITIAAGDSMDRIDTAMAPLFAPRSAPEPSASPSSVPGVDAGVAPPVDGTARVASGASGTTDTSRTSGTVSGIDASTARDLGRVDDHRDRNLGIGLTAGGGVALVIGIALLASYSSVQDKIDDHATQSRDDFDDLRSLESKAASYSIAGDLLVVAGLAAGGIGTYYLYRNHKRHRVAITPTPMGRGAGLTLTIVRAP